MAEKRFKLSDWCGEQNVSNVIDIEKQTHLINIEVVKLLNEQQATIEQLKSELNDCEKFRYTVFKRLNDEYIKERSL